MLLVYETSKMTSAMKLQKIILRKLTPARLIAESIDHSDTFSHVHIGYSRGNCAHGRRRLWVEVPIEEKDMLVSFEKDARMGGREGGKELVVIK